MTILYLTPDGLRACLEQSLTTMLGRDVRLDGPVVFTSAPAGYLAVIDQTIRVGSSDDKDLTELGIHALPQPSSDVQAVAPAVAVTPDPRPKPLDPFGPPLGGVRP